MHPKTEENRRDTEGSIKHLVPTEVSVPAWEWDLANWSILNCHFKNPYRSFIDLQAFIMKWGKWHKSLIEKSDRVVFLVHLKSIVWHKTLLRVSVYFMWKVLFSFSLKNVMIQNKLKYIVSKKYDVWKYSKFLLIWYLSIWNSHPVGKNLKENFQFLQTYSRTNLWCPHIHSSCGSPPAVTSSTASHPSSHKCHYSRH
jgi:hypothetical protein